MIIQNIPSRWKQVLCKDVIDVRDGTHDTPTQVLEGIPLITSKNLKPEGIDFKDVSYISEADYLKIEKRSAVDDGDVLFAMIGTIGNPVIVKKDRKFSIKNVALFKLKGSPVLPAFLKNLLSSTIIQEQLTRTVRGGNQKFVSLQVLRNLLIPLPPLAEQRRIADVLNRAHALQAQRRTTLSELGFVTQSIFFDLFSDPSIPMPTIGNLLESGVLLLHKDGNHGSLYPRASDFCEEGVPFISAKAISDEGLLEDALIQNLRAEKAKTLRSGWIKGGDVLLAHNASVGKVVLYEGQFSSALIGTSLTAFRPNPEALDSHYLSAALRSAKFQRELAKIMGQTTRNQVPITSQRQLRIGLPSIELQRKFGRRARAVEKVRKTQRVSLAEFDALFTSLQYRAFRGEL